MKKKVIPFPGASLAAPLPEIETSSRILANIGKQRVALDISCCATVLNPSSAPIVKPPMHTAGRNKAIGPEVVNMVPQDVLSGCGERVTEIGGFEIRTKLLRLRERPQLGDRLNGWRVCWLGGWDKGRISFVVMVERKRGLQAAVACPPTRTKRR